MKDQIKKVSFRVRRIYYNQFANGTKHEELRSLTPYWCKILLGPEDPEIAVIHTPGQPTLRFHITEIYIDYPEVVLGRKMSEQGQKDIETKLCIVTKIGKKGGIK